MSGAIAVRLESPLLGQSRLRRDQAGHLTSGATQKLAAPQHCPELYFIILKK